MQRDEKLVRGRHLRRLVDRGRTMALDLADEIAGEGAERTTQEVDDGDLTRGASVRGVDRLHRDGGSSREDTCDRGADGGAPAPDIAREEQAGNGRQDEGTREPAGGHGGGDGEDDLEEHRQVHRPRGPRLHLTEGLDRSERDERDARDREVVAGMAQDAEEDPRADRDPAGGDREPDEPGFDSGRGLVARGQHGRQTAKTFR